MFDNKGFTLVELLSIVVILAIIIVLAVPNIGKQIDKSEEETKTILNKKIEEASHIYASKYFVSELVNLSELVNCNDSACNNISFTLNDLERDGLIKLDDDECPNDRKKEIIIKYSNGIEYNYNLDCYNK